MRRDFNHDLKALTDDGSERESWAYPFPREELPEGFRFCLDDFTEKELADMHNSARNADEAYNPETTYMVTLDGFIISDNIKCTWYENVDWQYRYSDHDPVYMRFYTAIKARREKQKKNSARQCRYVIK